MVNRENMEELMAKFLSGNMTPGEEKAFEQWRKESGENENEFLAFKMAWDLVDKPGSFDRERAWEKVQDRIDSDNAKVIPFYRQGWVRIAASLLLVLSIGLALYRWDILGGGKSYTALSGVQNINEFTLDDRSVVSLRSGAILKVENSFGQSERRVRLKGTAFFEVERDESKPFVISTDFGGIQVLGTSFLVRTDTIREITLVHVESGKVLVFPDDDPLKGIEITVDESAEVSPGQVRKIQIGNTNLIAWKSKKIKFKQAGLDEVMSELADIYGYRIDMPEAVFEDCAFTGRFSELPLITIMDQLKEIYGFDYTISGKTINISGGGC